MKTSRHHEIKINLDGEYAAPAEPIPFMWVGDTVRYWSDGGEVRIVFPDRSPYRADDVTKSYVPGAVILTLVTANETEGFMGRCYITPPGKAEVGWSPDYPAAGGVHRVGHG
jgi:hypothetical protein